MIVSGADTHKRSHTLAAVDEATGRALADVTVPATPRSLGELLRCALGVGDGRVWALAAARPLARARDPAARADRPALAATPRPTPGARRAVHARSRRPRRADPHPRAHARDNQPRARARRAGRRVRASARRRSGLRD